MNLSAPTNLFFIISLILAVIGLIVGLGIIPSLPISAFWIVIAGYAVLAFGCLFKGA